MPGGFGSRAFLSLEPRGRLRGRWAEYIHRIVGGTIERRRFWQTGKSHGNDGVQLLTEATQSVAMPSEVEMKEHRPECRRTKQWRRRIPTRVSSARRNNVVWGVWSFESGRCEIKIGPNFGGFMQRKSMSVSAAAISVGVWMGLCATVVAGQVTGPPPKDTESRQHGFSVERIYGTSSLLGHPTTGIVWAPDGKHVSYFTDLAGGVAKQGRRKELWEMDAATGEKQLLVGADKLDNALPVEAGNKSQATGLGRHAPGQYQWAPNGEALLLQGGTALAWFDLKTQTAKTLVSGKEAIADPKISPDGKYVSFVRAH